MKDSEELYKLKGVYLMEIGVFISAIAVLGTLIGFVIRLSITLGGTMEKLKNLSQKVAENHEDAEKNFKELYDFKSESQQTLARISEALNNISTIVNEIKSDLKDIKNK